MIKKKLLYIFIITAVLVGPIMYWLNSLWGVSILKLANIELLKYIMTHDKFLSTATAINSVLYIIALVKIFTMKERHKDNTNEQVKTTKNEEVGPSFLNNTSQSEISKWENLYGSNNTPVNQNAPKQEDVQPLQSQSEISPSAPVQQERQNEEVKISVQPKNNAEQPRPVSENIVNMPESVTARDVYKNMINDIILDNGYTNMGAQVIANTDVDFVSIAESDTLILGLISTETGEIIANEISNSSDDAPSWFTNEHKFTSPVWEIKNVANIVQNMINEVLPEDNGIVIKPIVVLPSATVSNFEDIHSKWEEIGVDVVRFMNHSKLPNLTDVLPDKKGTEVLESYKNFIDTLMKYFKQKARKIPAKKVG